jgi:hypothetical protein
MGWSTMVACLQQASLAAQTGALFSAAAQDEFEELIEKLGMVILVDGARAAAAVSGMQPVPPRWSLAPTDDWVASCRVTSQWGRAWTTGSPTARCTSPGVGDPQPVSCFYLAESRTRRACKWLPAKTAVASANGGVVLVVPPNTLRTASSPYTGLSAVSVDGQVLATALPKGVHRPSVVPADPDHVHLAVHPDGDRVYVATRIVEAPVPGARATHGIRVTMYSRGNPVPLAAATVPGPSIASPMAPTLACWIDGTDAVQVVVVDHRFGSVHVFGENLVARGALDAPQGVLQATAAHGGAWVIVTDRMVMVGVGVSHRMFRRRYLPGAARLRSCLCTAPTPVLKRCVSTTVVQAGHACVRAELDASGTYACLTLRRGGPGTETYAVVVDVATAVKRGSACVNVMWRSPLDKGCAPRATPEAWEHVHSRRKAVCCRTGWCLVLGPETTASAPASRLPVLVDLSAKRVLHVFAAPDVKVGTVSLPDHAVPLAVVPSPIPGQYAVVLLEDGSLLEVCAAAQVPNLPTRQP